MNAKATKIAVPKVAQKFIDDAKAAGYRVKVEQHDEVALSVFVDTGHGADAGVTWMKTTVYDAPLSSERLGFRTHGGREAVRFSHATVKDYSGNYHSPRSVRQVRGHIGLVI